MHQVLWLPAHPASGSHSMDRYWREIEGQRLIRQGASPEFKFSCPLGSPPESSRTAPRVITAIEKYVVYPWMAGRAARRDNVSVAHVFDHSYAHLLTRLPRRGVYKIATVHDLAPLRDPGGLTPAQQRRFRRTVGHLREADLLLADSRHSAQETAELLGIDRAKIRVLPLGVHRERFEVRASSPAFPALPAELSGRRVVLSVGVDVPRKNLRMLPEIFRQLDLTGVTLLRVGPPLSALLAEELRSVLGPTGLIELGVVDESVLIQAYQRADALIFPSLIEGFGFPVLEAMAAGCPVVCTNVTSLPEVGGDAALYFAPDAPATAAAHLQRVLSDPAFREALVVAGKQQAAAFSWSRHFEALLAIYAGDEVLPSTRGCVANSLNLR